jgi:predicted Rossmann fold nucleotide-binding protein DprA/Smf involved in DNA uptake
MNGRREPREVIREEPWRRRQILAALGTEAKTVGEIAEAIGAPADEVVTWLMGLRKYGWVTAEEDVEAETYRYRAVLGRARR